MAMTTQVVYPRRLRLAAAATAIQVTHRNFVIFVLLFVSALHLWVAVDFLAWPRTAALAVIVLGAPHGALDVAIAAHRQRLNPHWNVGRFLAAYVGFAACIAALWYLLPGICLVAFLVLSAFHFGGDWVAATSSPSRLVFGAAILLAPTVAHFDQVEAIFSWLAPSTESAAIARAMLWSAPFVICAALVIAARRVAQEPDSNEFLVVLTTALVLPPITFFALYFCLLHSVRHMLEVRTELAHLSVGDLVRLGWRYAALAICGSLLGALLFQHLDFGPAFISAVFVTLASLTGPHILLMDYAAPPHNSAKGTSFW
jgi:beta-carotene 15,15'-dioxygenase